MNPLSREERLFVLELVTEIASEAAQNPNVVWMIEFQEELVEKLYRRMVALLEEPGAEMAAAGAAGAERGKVPLSAEGRSVAGKSGAQRPRQAAKRSKPAKNPR